MNRYFFIKILLLLGLIEASTPLNLHISYHSGYDNNVMRFSGKEIEHAGENKDMMGGASTFDSYIKKINTNVIFSIQITPAGHFLAIYIIIHINKFFKFKKHHYLVKSKK